MIVSYRNLRALPLFKTHLLNIIFSMKWLILYRDDHEKSANETMRMLKVHGIESAVLPIKEIELENLPKIIKIRNTKTITIECYNESDKKKIVKEIERIKKGRKKFKLNEENLDRIINILSKAETIATLAVKVAIKIKELKENKE